MDKFIFFDPIHGKVVYPGYIKTLINTEEFQRLRDLKQLGASSRVFYSATHSRFEHCLGVCYLSLKLMKTLETNCGVTISEIHKKCVAIAALFHDIGHGPFSHMWEEFVRTKNPSDEWSHEQTSSELTKHIFNKYNIKLSDDTREHFKAIEIIQNLILGDLDELKRLLGPNSMYLTEIVANKFTSIDVDKQDYILRDEYFLRGNILLLEFQKLFDRCRITKDLNNVSHISYNIEDYDLISNMFENRANLHIYCYQEPTVRGIEQMLIDALVLAEDAGFMVKGVPLSLMHKNIEKYVYLTDTVTSLVKTSDDEKLIEAQKLLHRLDSGDLYELIWMSTSPFNLEPLTEKFGPHFFQMSKRIPLSSVFMTQNFIFHDDLGNRVEELPENKITKRGFHYEEYLIFSKNGSAEFLNSVKTFLSELNDKN